MTRTFDIPENKILILDFGSQYTQLIARRIREQKVYAEIIPFFCPIEEIKKLKPKGIILSGGPSSVFEKNAPKVNGEIFNLGVPVLGICYGLYLIVDGFKGKIEAADSGEYGAVTVNILKKGFSGYRLFKGFSKKEAVWMSHGDKVTFPPQGFTVTASSQNAEIAGIANEDMRIYGVQFHPEVHHTVNGVRLLKNFIFDICELTPDWRVENFIDSAVEAIRQTVGDEGTVLLGLSGGVDSSVAAALIQRAIGNRLCCVFVNNGLLRKDEAKQVIQSFKKNMKLNLIYADASKMFLGALKGVTDPEKKRRIIGAGFIRVFKEEAKKLGKLDFLAQGTLYPDVIESVSAKGPSDIIKSHHNRVPEVLKLIKSGKVIEPIKELFKDEVRRLGLHLGLPEEIVYRHPFPGPGLAIRIIGEVTSQRIKLLQQADEIVISEVKAEGLYDSLWQIFAVFLPVRSVGVMGDKRTYENVIALRGVTSVDAMTADWAYLPENLMRRISNRIINEVKGVNRVVYDISSKPPSTIEWE